MRTIAVVSGKGGTGKTSIVASFAALAKPVTLADCDVDAADLHLILNPEIRKRNPFSGKKAARIDSESCINCDICYDLCRFEAIHRKTDYSSPNGKKLQVDPYACEGCGVCVFFCPARSISLEKESSGEWYISDTEYGPMVHARLGIAAENSGKLVTIVRNFARAAAESINSEYLIIDGSPGIGCPVIASVTGVDYVLIVTEPTVSGEHDMERIAGLASHFDLPVGICINKWDINPEITGKIEKWCEKNGNAILGKVRFDHAITQAQVEAVPVVKYADNGVVEDIKTLWNNLQMQFKG